MAAPTSTAAPARPGLGTRCAEAQADGVPCPQLGTDCEVCGRAQPCRHADAGLPAAVAPAAPGPQ